MPIYEFKCQGCGRITSIFARGINASYEAKCQHCGSADLARTVSRFAYCKSEQAILEEYGEPGLDASLEQYRDPRQIGRWVERRFQEFGMDLPEESKRMIEAAREGEFPEPVKDI